MSANRTTLLLTLLVLVIVSRGALAQPVAALSNLPDKLAKVHEVQPLSFSLGSFKLPPGGHLQGIQLRYDAADKRHLAFLSHDSLTVAYLLVVAFPASSPSEFSSPGHVVHVQQFPSDGKSPPLRHAGGIQISGDTLVVGVEDNQAKNRSQVQFWDISNPKSIVQLKHLTIERSSDQPKDATSGAVGLARTANGHLLAVANWDSRAIDFYQSNAKPLADPLCRFEHSDRWTVADADKQGWVPDTKFGTYQAINLVADSDQKLYLLGFDTAPVSGDCVDLYSIEHELPIGKRLRKLARRPVPLRDANHFRYGGGVGILDGRLVLFASPRGVEGTTTLNVAQ